MTRKIQNFRFFATASTVATYILIFVGGLVRVSGAGLGCPDWPKCFGRWIPPTNIAQLPPDIDPALFNFTLAWIEYINRLVGVIIGLLIFITAILAVKNFRDKPKLLFPSIAALILVAYQGWHGSQVVASQLEPFMISIHMLLAFLIVSLLIYTSQQAYYEENPDAEKNAKYPDMAPKIIGFLWLLFILQVVLGTEVRAAIQHAAEQTPLLSDAALLQASDPVNYIHGLFGVILLIFTWFFGTRILRQSENMSNITDYGVKLLLFLVTAQVVIGGILIGFELPELMQLYHLWSASLIVGVLLLLYSAMKRKVNVLS